MRAAAGPDNRGSFPRLPTEVSAVDGRRNLLPKRRDIRHWLPEPSRFISCWRPRWPRSAGVL